MERNWLQKKMFLRFTRSWYMERSCVLSFYNDVKNLILEFSTITHSVLQTSLLHSKKLVYFIFPLWYVQRENNEIHKVKYFSSLQLPTYTSIPTVCFLSNLIDAFFNMIYPPFVAQIDLKFFITNVFFLNLGSFDFSTYKLQQLKFF